MEKWTNVVIHHSASEFGCREVIKQWHLQRGWRDIGYHFVIGNGFPTSEWKKPLKPFIGSIEIGRLINDDTWVQDVEIGAHVLGFNKNSIGICLIHLTKFYIEQIFTLFTLCQFLSELYQIPYDNFFGHYELDVKKPDCPGFDMKLFREALKNQNIRHKFIESLVAQNKLKTE